MNLILRLFATLLIFLGIFTIVFSVLTAIYSFGAYPWITASILVFGTTIIILGTYLWRRIFQKTRKSFDPITGKAIAAILVSYGLYALFTRILFLALEPGFQKYLLIPMIPGCFMEILCIALWVWIWKNIPIQKKW